MTNPNPLADPSVLEGFHEFQPTEQGQEPYGSFEVFWNDATSMYAMRDDNGTPIESGWYWWPCFPGCLPESDPIGPFENSVQAYADAQNDS